MFKPLQFAENIRFYAIFNEYKSLFLKQDGLCRTQCLINETKHLVFIISSSNEKNVT